MPGQEEEILPVKKFKAKLMAGGFSVIDKALAIFENNVVESLC